MMRSRATLMSVRQDWKTGKVKIELLVDYVESLEKLMKLIGSAIRLDIVK